MNFKQALEEMKKGTKSNYLHGVVIGVGMTLSKLL